MEILLVADRDFLPVALRLLQAAKVKIEIMAYAFSISGGKSGKNSPLMIARELIELKASLPKLKIQIFLEGFRQTKDRNLKAANFLSEHGVEVRFGSTHVKAICIDQKFLLLGSTNLTSQSIEKNFETNLFLNDKKVAQLFSRYFEHYWMGGKYGLVKLPAPFYADGDFLPELVKIIDRAKLSIHFSIYFFNFPILEQALIAANDRGVAITGLLHSHDSFALNYVKATAATALRLKRAGFNNLHFAPKTLFSHSKYLVSDSRIVFLGTGNWIPEDSTTNPQLYLKATNVRLAKSLIQNLKLKIDNEGRTV